VRCTTIPGVQATETATGARHGVVVLGMARTGSSALTRLLNLLGVDLGPEEGLVAPVEHINAKGFYEHRAIMQLNDELLSRLGGSWHDPPLLAPGWAEDPRLDDLRDQAQELLAQSFTTSGPWGFKDPRTCFTLPFWRPLIGDARLILCHRNPLEVAGSLERRDGLRVAHGVNLWARYASAAALGSAGAARIVIGYDELFRRPHEVLGSLAAFIGRHETTEDPETLEAAEAWIEPDLKHHSSSVAEVLAHPDVAPDVRALHLAYELVVSGRRGTETDPSAELALDTAAEAVDVRLSRRGGGTREAVRTAPGLTATRPAAAGADVATMLAADLAEDLDFVVIGALPDPVATLLAGHPQLELDGPAGDGMRGVVRPGYATGDAQLPLEEIAYRIAAARPGVRLILALEEPVAQARELHRRAVADGLEHRELERALRDQLRPANLAAARRAPRPATSYLVSGEYGRIADAYLTHLPASQMLVVTAGELAFDAAGLASRLAEFLGVEDTWSAEALTPPPDRLPVPLDRALDDALRAHFVADARRVRQSLGVRVPWAAQIPVQRTPGPRQATVAVVVIVHDTPDELAALLDSVRSHIREQHEIMVIDNGSGQEAAGAIHELARRHGAGYRRLEQNERFARACNYAIRRTEAEEILLINSDCVLTAGALENMRAALASAPEVAAVGPRSNSAHAAQGGIWLDDSSPEGIDRFGRFFNHPSPERWFDIDWLVAFALLIKRSAFNGVGGFDGKIRTGAAEDRDLCRRLREVGHTLLCAGDAFVFHWGQRTYDVAGVNRTALRFGHDAAVGDPVAPQKARLLRRRIGGRTYEVANRTAWHVESSTALRLIREGREVKDVEDKQIDKLAVGPPICLVRAVGSDDVYVIHCGTRRLVTGDRHRIRRLPGLSLTEPERLERLPLGEPVAVEDAIAPVPELASVLPDNPAAIRPGHLAGAAAIAEAAAAAVHAGDGFSLIRIGTREALVLNDGAWDVVGSEQAFSRIGPDGPDARALRAAVVGADAVAVPDRRDSFPFAPLVEQVLFHLDLYPPMLASWDVGYELLGFDPQTGRGGHEAPLTALLDGTPVAVVGPLAREAARYAPDLGLDVRVVLELTRGSQIERVLDELAAVRDAYDVVLVAAGPPGRVLCSRAARELGAVALDLGHALDRLLYLRFGISREIEVAARWQADQYLREALQPPLDPPHPLEGQLVRVAGERGQYLIERGRARRVTHRALSAMLGGHPREIDPDTFAQLPTGMPLAAVHDRRAGLQLLLGGRRVPLRTGIRAAAVDDLPLQMLPEEDAPVDWFPGADPPPVRHTNTSPR
jgi:glycosyltransferase involved in cell wall biosynthesis